MPLYDADVVKPLIRALKGLQDVLGLHQDREVQMQTLKRLGDHVVVQPGGTAALMAMGALIERLEADAAGRADSSPRASPSSRPTHSASSLRRRSADDEPHGKPSATPRSSRPTTSRAASARPRPPSTSPTSPPRTGTRRCSGTSIRRRASTYLFRVRPKVKGGGRGLLKRRSHAGDHVKATDHERLDLLPADFSYRHLDLALDQFKKPAARLRKVLEPLRETTTTSSSTARRASRWSPRACSRPPTRCWCR